MRQGARVVVGTWIIAAVAIVALLPGASPVAFSALAPHPSAHAAPHVGMSVAHRAGHVRPGIIPIPCNTMPAWPAWGEVGDGWTPTPFVPYQSGCGGTLFVGQDEVHASMLSSAAGSGQRWTLPVHLPKNDEQNYLTAGLYLSAVVSGDSRSPWNQSLVEIAFWPNGASTNSTFGYTVTTSVYSMFNDSSVATAVCPSGWLALAWNSSFWCEGSDFTNASGFVFSNPVMGGDYLNVTFSGVAKTTPLRVWENDSTTPSGSFDFSFNYTNTGTYNFTPAYATACGGCLLQWGMGVGNGIAAEMCPQAAAGSLAGSCNSYNAYGWIEPPVPEFGIAQYWTGSGYTGDFQYIGFESTSGECSYVPGSSTITVALCIATTIGGGTGYYPYFTFNGTALLFGGTFNWTTWDLGGPSIQFNAGGTMTPKPPLYVDRIADDSRGGYTDSGLPINVSARFQVYGHMQNASLIYQLPGGGWTSVAMTRTNGTSSLGYYNATIPGGGTDGTVRYWTYGLDRAGINTSSIVSSVSRGPLPTFSISLSINPTFCGKIVLNGTQYANGGTALLQPGTYGLGSTGCYPYINPVFIPSHTLSVLKGGTELLVKGNGALELSFTFNPPILSVLIAINPSTCGASVTIGSTTYSGGATASITWNRSYSVSATPCANTAFAGYSGSTDVNATVLESSQTLVATKNGTLTANFVPSSSSFPVLFLVAPGNCGGAVAYNGASYENDSTISAVAGAYPMSPVPCPKFGFKTFNLGGGSSYSNGNVTLTSQATITLVQYHLTIITIRTLPPWCGGVVLDGLNLTNGQSVIVANNSTHTVSAYSCPGYNELGFAVTGGLHLAGNIVTANGSGEIDVSFTNQTLSAWVGFETDPQYCGSIGFNGQVFYDTNYTFVPVGTVATLSATPCTGNGLLRWLTVGGITIVNNTATITASGSIKAVFTALVDVFISTNPAGCGTIVIGGRGYVGGTTATYPSGTNVSLSVLPCPGLVFDRWVYSPGVTIANDSSWISINAGSELQAVFVPVTYPVQVFLDPSNCGHLTVNTRPAFSGSTLRLGAGTYPLTMTPCAGDAVIGYQFTGNVSVTDGFLNVSGPGSVTILLGPVPPIVTLQLPSSTAAGLTITLSATVQVPIFPYNYTYNWSFGDGSSDGTNVNSTFHSFGSAGVYQVQVVVTDPLGRQAVANGTISVSAISETSTATALIPAAAAVLGAVAIVVVAWWYSGRRPPEEREPEAAGTYGSPGAPDGPEAPTPSGTEPLPKEP